VARVHLKGINTVRKRLADGTVRIHRYHRATGRPLPGEVGSREFMAAYGDAERSIANRLKGTFAGLIADYTASLEFEQLAASTQETYRRQLTAMERPFGDMPIAALNDPAVRKEFTGWARKVAETSGAREADMRLAVISAMLTWALENHDGVVVNHLRGFKHRYHSDRSEMIWTPEHIAAFMAVAPVEMQRALILAVHSGQRQGDLLRLCWTQYDGAFIRLRQGKSRRRGKPGPLIEIPVTQALKRMLDSIPRTATTILTSRSGRPFGKRNFSKQWVAATRAAGIQELHFHDIRGTSVTLLSEAGATHQQVAAITGHSLRSVAAILDRYLARTRGLAEQAIFHFENSPRTDFANRLQTGRATMKRGDRKT